MVWWLSISVCPSLDLGTQPVGFSSMVSSKPSMVCFWAASQRWSEMLLCSQGQQSGAHSQLCPQTLALERRALPRGDDWTARASNEHIGLGTGNAVLYWLRHTWFNFSSCTNELYFHEEITSHFSGNQWPSWSIFCFHPCGRGTSSLKKQLM